MSATILDGKMLASKIKKYIHDLSMPVRPKLAVISFLNYNQASDIYIKNKHKDCEECDIGFENVVLSVKTTTEELISTIDMLQADASVTGIMVQLPAPPHIDVYNAIQSIDIWKDVDGLTALSQGQLMQNSNEFYTAPCTPSGIMELLRAYQIDPAGKHCVIVGRSNIVGKPLAQMMLNANATVTICHSKTPDLKSYTKDADILVSAVGKEKLITMTMVKDDAVVIDVGMNRNEDGKLCGDVDFNLVKYRASYITPVPGGVGPMTRAMLMWNCVRCCQEQTA